MADVSGIFGGPWMPSGNSPPPPVEDQIRAAMIDAGLEAPGEIFLDGKIHRFSSGTAGSGGHDKPGWYIFFSDGVPAGRFGCWRSGIEMTWRAEMGREISAAEEMAHARRMAEAKVLRDAEAARKHETISAVAEKIWTSGAAALPDHPYLKRKGIKTHGARVTGDGRLMIPLYDSSGSITSLQYIDADGGKLYHAGGQTGGKYWMIGTPDQGPVYIAEGFATAATIHEVSARPCAVAYSASNITSVTAALRDRFGVDQELIIVADHDLSGIGQRYADQASAKYGARVIIPPILGDANDYMQGGHDLLALLSPPVENWLIPADVFCAQPAPITWLIQRWLQKRALIMIHGPSGGGKTFVVLDWCLHIAAGLQEWHGHKIRPGEVVYLAGEGHHGLRGRVAAWKSHHQADRLTMWLSQDGCDLNTSGGYAKVVKNIRALKIRPVIIIVDTLHRFLLGDENSAQDAKVMLDSCNALMSEFDCSVGLVHHTGVSDEAQHRARGSSAWRGALDIEISIVPGKPGQPLQIIQRKNKDAEIPPPILAHLRPYIIPGWLDDDGQPITSAIVIPAEKEEKSLTESVVMRNKKLFERGWIDSGCELRDGMPYLSRSGLTSYFGKIGVKKRMQDHAINPMNPDGMIGKLLDSEIIDIFEHGWKVKDDVFASVLLISRNSGQNRRN